MTNELCMFTLPVMALFFGLCLLLSYRLGLRDGLWQSGRAVAPFFMRPRRKPPENQQGQKIAKRVEEF